MIYGIYQSAQGAETQSLRLDTIANNLANAGTTAFKRDLMVFQQHDSYDAEQGTSDPALQHLSEMPGGVAAAGTYTDFSMGPLTKTGGALDIAIKGPGFLKVSNGQKELLTRDGSLTLNEKGDLIHQGSGMAVSGEGGAKITAIPNGGRVEISSDGWVTQGGERLGRISLVQPDSVRQLMKVGNNLFEAKGRVAADTSSLVLQGYTEASGTKPMTEMIAMITASRAFESNLNMIKFQDDALGKLLQSASRK